MTLLLIRSTSRRNDILWISGGSDAGFDTSDSGASECEGVRLYRTDLTVRDSYRRLPNAWLLSCGYQ